MPVHVTHESLDGESEPQANLQALSGLARREVQREVLVRQQTGSARRQDPVAGPDVAEDEAPGRIGLERATAVDLREVLDFRVGVGRLERHADPGPGLVRLVDHPPFEERRALQQEIAEFDQARFPLAGRERAEGDPEALGAHEQYVPKIAAQVGQLEASSELESAVHVSVPCTSSPTAATNAPATGLPSG